MQMRRSLKDAVEAVCPRADIGFKTRDLLVVGAELIADGVLKSVTVKTELDATVQITLKGSAIFMRKTTKNTEELLSEGNYKQ